MKIDELRVIEIERGLTEWAEERARTRGVPVNTVLEIAARYPVGYMLPEPPPMAVATSPGGPLTLRQIIVAIVLAGAILASQGGGDDGHDGLRVAAPPPKPHMADSR